MGCINLGPSIIKTNRNIYNTAIQTFLLILSNNKTPKRQGKVHLINSKKAFTKMRKGRFYIGVMRIDGTGERLLTENFYQEAPSWSPNGRVLIFYRETKTDSEGKGFSAKLWSIDLTGYNERLIETETDGSDPSWSSLLSK